MATLEDAYNEARGHLGDISVQGGERWNDSRLRVFVAKSMRELADILGANNLPRAEREVFVNLPAYTTYLNPAAFGIGDLFEPEFIRERSITSSVAISSTTTTTPIQVTATAHGLSANQEVMVSGVTGTMSPWGRWMVTIMDANTFQLNGSYSDGQAGSGGTATTSTDNWSNNLEATDSLMLQPQPPQQFLGQYCWKDGVFLFPGASASRQLWIGYTASELLPTLATQPLGIDNATGIIGIRAAAFAAQSIGWYAHADQLNKEAFGPSMTPDGTGGLLRTFLQRQTTSDERTPRRFRRFRDRRTEILGWS